MLFVASRFCFCCRSLPPPRNGSPTTGQDLCRTSRLAGPLGLGLLGDRTCFVPTGFGNEIPANMNTQRRVPACLWCFAARGGQSSGVVGSVVDARRALGVALTRPCVPFRKRGRGEHASAQGRCPVGPRALYRDGTQGTKGRGVGGKKVRLGGCSRLSLTGERRTSVFAVDGRSLAVRRWVAVDPGVPRTVPYTVRTGDD